MNPNAEQQHALDAIDAWLSSDVQVFRLGGLAGTGKTTTTQWMANILPRTRTAYAAPTNKAAAVLRSKLPAGTPVATVHSLIYTFKGEQVTHSTECPNFELADELEPEYLCECPERPVFEFSGLRQQLDIIVVDEASMVDTRMDADLLSTGCRILYVGDFGQLPPVSGSIASSVVAEDLLDVRLEEIHRQGPGSTITLLAHKIRQGGMPAVGAKFGGEVSVMDHRDVWGHPLRVDTQHLCYTNSLRHKINSRIRSQLGFADKPQPYDRVMCLTNVPPLGLYNGAIGVVRENSVRLEDDSVVPSMGLHMEQDEDLERGDVVWAYAYAITVHKSQGSEWPSVTLWTSRTETLPYRSQWLYTGCTRAKSRLVVARDV